MIRTWIALLSLLFIPAGCQIIAVASHAIPRYTEPKYTGFAGQSVGVMVWADTGVKIDWPGLSLDSANSLNLKLQEAAKKQEMLKGSTFPVQPASIVRYQMDHPEIEAHDIAQIAPKLGVSRLIYLEVEDFATRAVDSVELFRGSMTATMRIIEVNGTTAKVVYEENNIRCTYPPKVPEEGLPRGNDYQFYVGTVNTFTDEVLKRLVPVEIP